MTRGGPALALRPASGAPGASGRPASRPGRSGASAGHAAPLAPPPVVRVLRRGPATVIEIPGLRTVCEANRSRHENRFVKAKRVKEQRHIVTLALNAWSTRCPWPPPLHVVITRLSAGHLDPFDNLPSALKACVDALCRWAGVDDRDERVIRFEARQERVPRGTWGVRIEIRRGAP